MKRLIKFSLSFLTILVFSCTTAEYSTAQSGQPKYLADPNNKLNGKTEMLEMEYIVWGCACANWIKLGEYENHDGRLIDHAVFIEPATEALELPADFDASRHYIRVKGQFYEKPDYPKGTMELEEPLAKAKVFRYTEMEVLEKEIK